MEIRSYRRVFDLERRIYRVDRMRLNPGGIPVRGLVYFLAILASTWAAGRLPLVGVVAKALPWYLSGVALPAISAAVLTIIRVEGRPFHVAAYALVRYWTGPRRLAGIRPCAAVGDRWRPEEIVLLPDGSDSRVRSLRYTGPGAVLVAIEHELAGRLARSRLDGLALGRHRCALMLKQLPDRPDTNRGQVVALAKGARLLVRGQRAQKVRR